MDPYLEAYWGDVHSSLATFAKEQLNERLPSDLVCRSEQRMVICRSEGRDRGIVPDASIVQTSQPTTFNVEPGAAVAIAEAVRIELDAYEFRQHYLEIRDMRSGGELITVIEFVSPVNKRPGDGLRKYQQKQAECHQGGVNLVEIDLTRSGDRSLIFPIASISADQKSVYAALVRRAAGPDSCFYHKLPLRQRLNGIPIPLRPADRELVLDLQSLVDRVYRAGRYGGVGFYDLPLAPTLSKADTRWAAGLISA